MSDLTIRPTAKFLILRFVVTGIVFLAIESWYFTSLKGKQGKTTRTIQLSRLQDVRVDQRPLQRMFRVGDISIETAGETSRLTIPDVDDPQPLADHILDRAHGAEAATR